MIGAGDHANANTAAGRGPAATTSPVIVPAARCHSRLPARSLLLRFAQRSPPATRNLPAGGEGKGYFSLLQYILERFFKLIYDNKSTNKKAKLHAFPAGGLRVASGNLCGIAAKATTELRVSSGHLAKRSNDRGCGSPVATFAAGKSNDRGGSRDPAAETREPRTAGETGVTRPHDFWYCDTIKSA